MEYNILFYATYVRNMLVLISVSIYLPVDLYVFFDVAHKCATILCDFKILQAPSGPTCPPAILDMWKKRKTSNSEWLMYPLIWLCLLLKCSKPSNPQIKHFVVLHFEAARQTHYSHAV